jgi:hypothetical protein
VAHVADLGDEHCGQNRPWVGNCLDRGISLVPAQSTGGQIGDRCTGAAGLGYQSYRHVKKSASAIYGLMEDWQVDESAVDPPLFEVVSPRHTKESGSMKQLAPLLPSAKRGRFGGKPWPSPLAWPWSVPSAWAFSDGVAVVASAAWPASTIPVAAITEISPTRIPLVRQSLPMTSLSVPMMVCSPRVVFLWCCARVVLGLVLRPKSTGSCPQPDDPPSGVR